MEGLSRADVTRYRGGLLTRVREAVKAVGIAEFR